MDHNVVLDRVRDHRRYNFSLVAFKDVAIEWEKFFVGSTGGGRVRFDYFGHYIAIESPTNLSALASYAVAR